MSVNSNFYIDASRNRLHNTRNYFDVDYDYNKKSSRAGLTPISSMQQADANVAPLIEIMRGKTVIGSSSGTPITQNVAVGDKVTLSARVTGGTPSNVQWSIPGTRVANYVVSFTPPPGSTNATVTELTSQTLQQNSITYYWVDGGTGRQPTVTATVNGQSATATGSFDVKQPSVTTLNQTHSVVAIQLSFGEPVLRYGNPSVVPGVVFDAVTNDNGIDGAYQWVQTYNENKTFRLLELNEPYMPCRAYIVDQW